MQQHIRCNSTKSVPRDPKQMLLSELHRQDREEASRIDLIGGRAIDQRLGASDQYLVLDSTQRDIFSSNPDKGVFVFNIRSGGVTGEEMIGVTDQLNDITEIEIQSFPFPEIPPYTYPVNPAPNADGQLVVDPKWPILIPNPGPGILGFGQLFCNRFILQIMETSVQSYSDTGGVRHQFAFDLLTVNNQLYASPVSPVYVFTDPITRFDTLTLAFYNPPRPLKFGNDALVGTRFGIESTLVDFKFINKDSVKVVVDVQIDGFDAYTYNDGAGTIQLNVDVNGNADTAFVNPATGVKLYVVQNNVPAIQAKIELLIGDRILFTNTAGGVNGNPSDGVYELTSIGASNTFTTLFTRTNDLNEVAECEKFIAVPVEQGTYAGKKFMMISDTVTNFAADNQKWVNYTSTMVLTMYYPQHGLVEGDRILVVKLDPKTVAQKIYNYVTRIDGLYVGAAAHNAEDYWRLNPDVGLAEFIYTSMTNNYITKNTHEARQYGFPTLRRDQIVVVPTNSSASVPSLRTAITDPLYRPPPANTIYGDSTLVNETTYKTFSTTYDTAAIIDTEVITDLTYTEFQYTGEEADLSDILVGILPAFDSQDFVTDLLLTGEGGGTAAWITPPQPLPLIPNVYGTATITDGVYSVSVAQYDTAAIVDKDIKSGDFVVFEYIGAAQIVQASIGFTDQTTYEAISTTTTHWCRNYVQLSTNENFLFRMTTNTTTSHAIDGGSIVTTTGLPAITPMKTGGKIIVGVNSVTSTLLSMFVIYLQDDKEVLYSIRFDMPVTDADTWYAGSKRFYISNGRTDEDYRVVWLSNISSLLPSGVLTPLTSPNIPLVQALSWWTPPIPPPGPPTPYGKDNIKESIKGGAGYNNPIINIIGGNGDATAIAIVFGGVITGITITDGGTGYTTSPLIQIIGECDIKAFATARVSGGAVVEITLQNDTDVYYTESTLYNTAALIDSPIQSGNYAIIKYVANETKYLNLHFGIIDRDTYTNMIVPNNIPAVNKDNWTIYQSITGKEGILLNLNPINPYVRVLTLVPSAQSWNYSSYYPNTSATDINGIYVPDTSYNSAVIYKTPLESGDYMQIQYVGDQSAYPSLYMGYINERLFEQILQYSQLVMTTRLVWETPSDVVYGSYYMSNGHYFPRSSLYDTAAATPIPEDITNFDNKIYYVGSTSKDLNGWYGFINKHSYTDIEVKRPIASLTPLIISKAIWTLPAPYKYGTGNSNGNTYKTTNNKYNTAAVVDYDIRNTPMKFQYTAKSTKNLSPYVGYIDQAAYEGLAGVTDEDNWAVDINLTINKGILFRVLPSDTAGELVKRPLSLASDVWTLPAPYTSGVAMVTTDGYQPTGTVTYNAPAIIDFALLESTSYVVYEYNGTITKNLNAYYGFIKENSYETLSGVADPPNWAVSPQITENEGILIRLLSPGDPLNTLGNGNSALHIIKSGVVEPLVDLGSAIADTSPGSRIRTQYLEDTSDKIIATATATITGGVVVDPPMIVNPGSGYIPGILYDVKWTGSGIDLDLKAHINVSGEVSHIQIINGGSGFDDPPILTIASPNSINIHFAVVQGNGSLLFQHIEELKVDDFSEWMVHSQAYIVSDVSVERYLTDIPTTNTGLEIIHSGNKTIYVDVGKVIEKTKEGSWYQLQFTLPTPTDVYVNFILHQSTGEQLINETVTLVGIVAPNWHTNKKAYITTKNKSDRYISNPIITDPLNWAVSGQLSFDQSILVKWLNPTDPSNPYAPNTARRVIYAGIPTTTDVGSTLANINTNGYVTTQLVINNATEIAYTIALTQDNNVVLDIESRTIDVVNAQDFIKDRVSYVSSYNIDPNVDAETYVSNTGDPNNWARDPELVSTDGYWFQVLSPTDSRNTLPAPKPAALLSVINGTTTVDAFTSTPDTQKLHPGAFIQIKVTATGNPNQQTVQRTVYQDDGSVLVDVTSTVTTAKTTVEILLENRIYATANDPVEKYKARLNCLLEEKFNGNVYVNNSSIITLNPIDTEGYIVVGVDSTDADTIALDFGFYSANGNTIVHRQLSYDVVSTADWYTNKRFFITTNDPKELYTSDKQIFGYSPLSAFVSPAVQIDGNIPTVNHVDSIIDTTYIPDPLTTITPHNWTMAGSFLTKREGILVNFNFDSGNDIGYGNGASLAFTDVVALSNATLKKNGYIQLAIERSTNDIIFEVTFVQNDGTVIGDYNATLSTTDGPTWLALTTKRIYITTNNTDHTFKTPDKIHSFKGATITPTGGYMGGPIVSYVTDFTNVVAGKSFAVGGTQLDFIKGRNRVTNINNSIISLTGQEIESLNQFYQVESLDDIKSDAIRLSQNEVIMPNATFQVNVPCRGFKIPMRFRRILRRVTQMSGI